MDDPDDDAFLAALLDDEPIPRPRRTGLRIVGATLLIGLIALLVFVPGGWLNDRGSSAAVRPTTTVHRRTSVTTAATLAEHPEGRRLTADGLAHPGRRQPCSSAPCQPDCAGMITAIAGRRYITSARHCLTDVLEHDVVSPEPGQAQEITGRLFATFHVFDPVSHDRLATLDRIAVGTGDLDVLVATTKEETERVPGPAGPHPRPGPRGRGRGGHLRLLGGRPASAPQRLTGVYLGVVHVPRRHRARLHRGPHRVPPAGQRHPRRPRAQRELADRRRRERLRPPAVLAEPRDDGQASGPRSCATWASGHRARPRRRRGSSGIDETLHLTPADYLRFDAVLHT